jgi:hypothetical protein
MPIQHSHHDRIMNPARDGWACYDSQEIFREMVLGEIKCGRVSRAHHARILSFAVELGISHTTAVQLISECCTESLASNDSKARRSAGHLASPRNSQFLRTGLVIGAIVAVELTLIWLFYAQP